MISLHNVTVQYPSQQNPALKNVSASFERATTTALLGQSGSGKSTILRLITGLTFPNQGTVSMNGTEIKEETIPSIRKNIGYAIQGGGLFPHLTAWENVTIVAQNEGWQQSSMEARVEELAELTELSSSMLQQYPTDLSGGQQQRVSLMRALMMQPDVILLDEPLSALDPMIRADLQKDLRTIFEQLSLTVIFVTHDIYEADYIAHRVTLLEHGSIIQQANSIEDFRKQPANSFVQRFVEAQSHSLNS